MMGRVEALVHRAATFPGGYALGIHLAAHTRVEEWFAEVTLPEGAAMEPGPGTRVDGHRLTPAAPTLNGRPGHTARGTVWVKVTGTDQAPVLVRVHVATPDGVGDAPLAPPVATEPRSRAGAVTADESTWPGATRMDGRSGNTGGGSGGGGGGGGQCELFIDWNNGIVRHKTDAGGGGGAGGGGSHGYYYDTEGRRS